MPLSELSVSTQNYLKEIWSLEEWTKTPATASALAERMGLRISSVSDGLKRLAAADLIEHQPYGAIELTETGRSYALAMIRRHRLIETFLVETLGYTWDRVHDEAEVLEHAVSDFMVDRIDTLLGRYRNLGITRRLRAADRAAVDEALARVELTDLADRQIGALSGGQRKRAFVARAIAQGAQLLLLDEPFAGVDKRSEAMLMQVIKQLRDEGATVLVSTHDLATLRQFADEALLLRGEILMHDTPEKVLAPENLVRAFGMEVDAGAPTATSSAATSGTTTISSAEGKN